LLQLNGSTIAKLLDSTMTFVSEGQPSSLEPKTEGWND